MVVKKATVAKATKTTTAAKAPAKKAAAPKKAAATKAVLYLNPENVGFRAGDVYNALASEGSALSLEEVAKKANISKEDALLGIGWLFKEGKIKEVDNKIALA